MSQDSEDVSTGNQTEEYDEPTVESDPEEEPRGKDTNRIALVMLEMNYLFLHDMNILT